VSKKPENVFIKRVKNANKNNYFQSIETYTTLGCADCFCVVNGSSFWLEFKHTNAKNLGLSKYQMAWQLKLIKHGGHVFNLVRVLSQRCLKTYRLEPLGVRLLACADDTAQGIEYLLTDLATRVK
jgi:penicillin-binding protein-related factor A (putative recombinase)